VSDWTWEYNPDAEHVVGDLSEPYRRDVEDLARRVAEAVGVRRIGHPFDIRESASGVKTHAEGPVMIWYQEDYRDDVVLILRVQHYLAPDADPDCEG
jgi:plasmid stabilization system protein ParE